MLSPGKTTLNGIPPHPPLFTIPDSLTTAGTTTAAAAAATTTTTTTN